MWYPPANPSLCWTVYWVWHCIGWTRSSNQAMPFPPSQCDTLSLTISTPPDLQCMPKPDTYHLVVYTLPNRSLSTWWNRISSNRLTVHGHHLCSKEDHWRLETMWRLPCTKPPDQSRPISDTTYTRFPCYPTWHHRFLKAWLGASLSSDSCGAIWRC